MAKKKSKTQKLKKNLKEKQKKQQKKVLAPKEEKREIKNSKAKVAKKVTKLEPKKEKVTKAKTTTKSIDKKSIKKVTKKATTTKAKSTSATKKKLVPKEKVKYNLPITKKTQPKKQTKKVEKKPELIENTKVDYNLPLKEERKIKEKIAPKKETKKDKKKFLTILLAILTGIGIFFKKIGLLLKKIAIGFKNIIVKIFKGIKNFFVGIRRAIVKNKAKKSLNKNIKENTSEIPVVEIEEFEDEELDKETIREQKRQARRERIKKKNIIIRLIYDIFSNRHIFFNAVLIMFFIVLLIGLKRIEVVSTGLIIYISIILIFLMLVAISYNRYFSGKLFTILLCVGMGFAIYRMQYTYDFIRNLNTNVYEYKTYYVVTFDNNQNKSIYNINNKKVGLLKENTINIERKLNTKIDNVNYLEYDNLNTMFNDFYDQKFRAVLVNENQYKYMKNYISENARTVKILYQFKANAKK